MGKIFNVSRHMPPVFRRMRMSSVLAAALFQLAMPIVMAEDRNMTLRVERVGDASSLSSQSVLTLFLILLFVVGMAIYLIVRLLRRRHRPKVRAHVERKAYEEKAPATYQMEHIIIEDEVEKHLKEEERIIVRLLRQREGRCEQGTLCIVSGFSKATLSRLLAELETRVIVRKVQQVKKNMVYLRI